MFAVIRTGGKQYKVAKNDRIAVERLPGEAGAYVRLDEVLMLGAPGQATQVGKPLVEGVAVLAEVVEQSRGEKILVFKKRRRKNYRRKNGHRQLLTVLRVADIGAADSLKAEPAPQKAAAAPAEGAAKPKAKAKAKPKAKKTEE